jgi:hypothetical protein
LEPSVFHDENTDGSTVVRPRHWPPAISTDAHDSEKLGFSKPKTHCFGLGQESGRCQVG